MNTDDFVKHFDADLKTVSGYRRWLCKSGMAFALMGLLMLPAYPNDLCQFANGPCLQQGVSLALSPTTAASQTLLSLQLTLPLGTQIIHAQLVGRDMYMGVIPVRFDKNGQATAIYGRCPSGEMVWQLQLELQDAQGERSTTALNWLADQ